MTASLPADGQAIQTPDGSSSGEPASRVAQAARAMSAIAARLSRVRAATVYLVVALVWGLTFCFVVPPFQQFDEVAHYQRAWAVSTGQITTDAMSRVRLPKAVVDLPVALNFIEVGEGMAPYSPSRTLDLLDDVKLGPSVETLCFASTPNALGHLPAAVGVAGARLLGLSPLAALYAARVMNLLIGVFVVYAAIRILPFGRPLYVLIALLPMTVNQFAAVNPDALTIAGTMLFFAYVLRLRGSPRTVSTVEALLLVAAGAVLLNVKAGYLMFAFLVLLIPGRVWSGWRRRLLWVSLVILATAGTMLAVQSLAPSSSPEQTMALYGPRGAQIDDAAQMKVILHHPGVFIDALRTTAGTASIALGTQAIGILGRGMVPISQAAIFVVLATLAGTLVATRDEPSLGWWGRGLVVLVCGATTVMLAVAMYLAATTVGADGIVGLQGRYFIPVLAVGAFAFVGLPRPPRWTLPLIVVAVALVLALFSFSALMRYYY